MFWRTSALTVLLSATSVAQDEVLNFADHVEPILREHCTSCHRGSRARNGLQLKSVETILKGGSSGTALVPGDSGSSLLYLAAAHEREPFMPPDDDRIAESKLATIRDWIDAGARLSATEDAPAAKASVGPSFVLPPVDAAAVMPTGLATQPAWWSERANAVTALATSPGAPLVAIGGHRQVSLYRIPECELVGVLPFPEGEIASLTFSPTGAILVAAGGRGGDSGLAVGWDLASGTRAFALGDEPDVALAADVTVDHLTLVLGGPDRVVRTYSTRTGELLYEKDEHTDWITAARFSPDGVLLATADRAGGVFVWETLTGREFHALAAQRGAVTSLAWRADSMLLAVGGEDGLVRLFEMEQGRRTRQFRGHDGILDVEFLRDGRIVTAGRDGEALLRDGDGKRITRFRGAEGIATQVAASFDGESVLVGDFAGRVSLFPAEVSEPVASLRPNPATNEEREQARAQRQLAALELELNEATAAHDSARSAARDADARASAAESAASENATRLAAAEEGAAEARRRAQESEGVATSYRPKLLERVSARAAALARSEELARVSTDAQAKLEQAVTRALEAEDAVAMAGDADRAAAEERERVAAELLEGAFASAQLASSRAAEAETELARRTAEERLWRERAAPKIALADADEAAAVASEDALAQARDAASAAASEAESLRSQLGAAGDDLARAADRLERAQFELEPLQQHLAEATQAWSRMRARLAETGGRVSADAPD